ncbi:MAG: hypothetical protein LBD08_02230 [Treponema sp.]|jgi:hypothetical protein|nr:hypothetical protein [Treponema sp.]
MAEHNNALDWNLVQELPAFVKEIISANDADLSVIDSAEKIKGFYPAVEKAVPVINAAGENQGKLWVEGRFCEGAERHNKRLSIGVWVSCRLEAVTVPVWVGIADDCHELYAWCPRKVLGAENPKADIGVWRYCDEDDAYWTPLSEQDEHEKVLCKIDNEELRKLYDKLKRVVKEALKRKDTSNPVLQDHPKTQKM